MKKGIVLVGLAVVGGAVAIVEEMRISALREELTATRPQSPDSIPEVGSASSGLSGREQSAASRTSKTERSAKPLVSPGSYGSPGSSANREHLRKITQNPAARAMMNQGHKAMATAWFSGLMRQFDFNQPEADHFTALVAATLMAQQDFGMKLMNAKDEAERKQLAQEMAETRTEQDTAVREFLNDDGDFAAYQQYCERLPERQQLDGLRDFMRGEGFDLPAEKDQALVDAMYRARVIAMPELQGSDDVQLTAFLSPDAEARFEQNWTLMQNALRKEIPAVLDAKQAEAFFNYQSQLKEMQLTGLQMARSMMEERTNQPPALPRQ